MANWNVLADAAVVASLGAFGQAITYQNDPAAPVSAFAILGATGEKEPSSPGRYARIFIRRADYPDGFVVGATVTFASTGISYTVFEIDAGANGVGAYATLRNGDL